MDDPNWKNRIDFVRCPNHEKNIGYRNLCFISSQVIKCELCGKEFSIGRIKQLRTEEHQYDLANLQTVFLSDLALLQRMSENFDAAEQELAADGGDSVAP